MLRRQRNVDNKEKGYLEMKLFGDELWGSKGNKRNTSQNHNSNPHSFVFLINLSL